MNRVPIKLASEKTEEILGMVGSPTIVISEIIKNSIDSNAKSIEIRIDTKNSSLTISDDGDGFTEKDIIDLGNPGYSTKKSSSHNTKRKDGYFYAGNKGLGILSAFSLSNLVEIETTNKTQSFIINWEKAKGELTYSEISKSSKHGTIFIIKEIDVHDIKVLTDEHEIAKLRHVTLSHFINDNSINIKLFINDVESSDLLCCNIDELDNLFIYKVDFSFKSKENILEFAFTKANPHLKKGVKEIKTDKLYKKLTIPLNNDIDLKKILKENFYLTKATFARKTNFNYLDVDLEDFYGSFFIKKDKPPKNLKAKYDNFLYGVRIFVNNFAMYSYLDQDNDWLGLSPLSQTNKYTTLMLHNVLGYINFNNFNERNSSLQITNERANFYQNASFKKLIEIVKFIVVNIVFSIDVAYRNNYIEYPQNLMNEPSKLDSSEEDITESDSPEEDTTESDLPEEDTTESDLPEEDTTESDLPEEDTTESDSPEEDTTESDSPEEDTTESDSPEEDTTESDSIETEIKMKKNNTKFFNKSTILKSDIPILIEHNELINQLKKLNYLDFYLLYNMAFRSILEDISKRYLAAMQIKLCGDFALNVKNMCDDMLKALKNESRITKENKSQIELLFGGFNALKNYLEVTSCEFYNNNMPGIRSNQLNSITHTPRWTDIKDAEYMANNIIIPLYVLADQIVSKSNFQN